MRVESQVDRNKLRQYSNDFLMYGKYNIDTLQNVIDTVNGNVTGDKPSWKNRPQAEPLETQIDW